MKFERPGATRLLALGLDFIERWRDHELITPRIGPRPAHDLPIEIRRECGRASR
jgi:hypothetical protein